MIGYEGWTGTSARETSDSGESAQCLVLQCLLGRWLAAAALMAKPVAAQTGTLSCSGPVAITFAAKQRWPVCGLAAARLLLCRLFMICITSYVVITTLVYTSVTVPTLFGPMTVVLCLTSKRQWSVSSMTGTVTNKLFHHRLCARPFPQSTCCCHESQVILRRGRGEEAAGQVSRSTATAPLDITREVVAANPTAHS